MKYKKISQILNLIIFICVLIASILMFTGIRFMDDEQLLETSGISLLKFFTVDSNILMGITSLLLIIYSKKTSKWLELLNLCATTGVSLTFFTVIFYLAPFSQYSYFAFFKNSNLFFHLIVPILSIINYIFYSSSKSLNIKDSFYGLIPMLLYSVYYVSNAILNMSKGRIIAKYDWYGFFANGVASIIFTIIFMLLSTYLISFLLIYFNKKQKYSNK